MLDSRLGLSRQLHQQTGDQREIQSPSFLSQSLLSRTTTSSEQPGFSADLTWNRSPTSSSGSDLGHSSTCPPPPPSPPPPGAPRIQAVSSRSGAALQYAHDDSAQEPSTSDDFQPMPEREVQDGYTRRPLSSSPPSPAFDTECMTVPCLKPEPLTKESATPDLPGHQSPLSRGSSPGVPFCPPSPELHVVPASLTPSSQLLSFPQQRPSSPRSALEEPDRDSASSPSSPPSSPVLLGRRRRSPESEVALDSASSSGLSDPRDREEQERKRLRSSEDRETSRPTSIVSGDSDMSRVEFRVITVLRQSVTLAIYRRHRVAHVKQLLAPVTGMPAESIVLVHKGSVLDDETPMTTTSVASGDILLARFGAAEAKSVFSLTAKSISGSKLAIVSGKSSDSLLDIRTRILAATGMNASETELMFGGTRFSSVQSPASTSLSSIGIGPEAEVLVLPCISR